MSKFAPKKLRVKLTCSEGLNIRPRALPRRLRFSPLGSASSATALPRSNSTVEPPLSSPKFKSPGLILKPSNKVHKRRCHCKQSRCVKLYCECFASGAYCNGCSCIDCQNNDQNEAIRMAAAEIILERKPNAFTPKIGGKPCCVQLDGEAVKDAEEMAKHNRGCQCKKTGCVKKYCECFQANIACSENCKCSDCKNFEDCEERIAVLGGACHDSKIYFQKTEATMSSAYSGHNYCQKLKRKFHEFLNSDNKDSVVRKLKQEQVNPEPLATSSKLIDPAHGVVTSTTPGSSNFAHSFFSGLGTRSLMADVIRPADARELCSVLVVASETARSLAEKTVAEELPKVKENTMTNVLKVYDRRNWVATPHVQNMEPENEMTGNQNNGIGTDGFRSDGSNIQERTIFPTEKDGLICYKEMSFNESALPNPNKSLCSFMETQESSRKHAAKTCEKVLVHDIVVPDNCSSEDCSNTVNSLYCRPDSTDMPHEESETDRLTCNEDKAFVKAAFPDACSDCFGVYIEQERHVLTCFREFLRQLISFGTEKAARILSEIQLENLVPETKLKQERNATTKRTHGGFLDFGEDEDEVGAQQQWFSIGS